MLQNGRTRRQRDLDLNSMSKDGTWRGASSEGEQTLQSMQ